MSTVGSDYSAHRRSIDDLEKEYETARQQARRREAERESKLERSVERSLAQAEEKTAEAVNDIRDKFERSAARREELDKTQREELRKELYDRAGRKIQASADEAKERASRASQAVEDVQHKYRKLNDDIEDYYDQRASDSEKAASRRLEELQETHREEVRRAREESSRGNGENSAAYKEKVQRDAQKAIEAAHDLVGEERRKNRDLVDTLDKESRYRDQKRERYTEQRLQDQDRKTQAVLEENARYERVSRAGETAQLRAKLDEAARFKAAQQKESNAGRAEAIREFENDWRSQLHHVSHSYETERDKMKEDAKESEKKLDRLFNESLRDQGQRMAKVISRQNLEHAQEMADAVSGYDRAKKQIEHQARRSVELSQEAGERQRGKLVEEKNDALNRQAKTYQQALSRQKQQDGSTIDNLERLLNEQNSTDDPARISAAAEASVRRQMEAKYEKTFQAEANRNARGREHLYRSYEKKLDDAQKDHSFATLKNNQKALIDQENLKDQFLSHVQDVEHSKQQLQAHTTQQLDRTREALTHQNERTETELRRHYEDLLTARELESDYQINTLRQNAEFEKKNMRREFSAQTGEMIRNYEKRLTEQKNQYEDQLRELRARTDNQVRDNEKRLKQALEQQERATNQRLAEAESQHRERERLMSQRHEDEMDKVKRSNALLLSKQSAKG